MPYNNPNSYGSLYVDGIRTPFLDIGEIDDSPSDGGAICNVTIPGYLPTLKLSPKAEIYDYHGDLAAVGNVQIDSVKTGLKPRTSFSVISYNKHLQRKRIVGQFSNTLTLLLASLITQGNASAFFPLIIFRTSPEVPTTIVSRYIDFKHLKDAIPEVLAGAGKVLTYKVPIDQSGVEIIEPGFAGLAPIPILKLDDLYTNRKLGINNVSYTPIGRFASVVRFFGLNGREYFKSYLGKSKQIPLDPLVMRAQDGVNNYPLPEKATEIILIRITTPEPTPSGCTISTTIEQSNVETRNELFFFDKHIPVNLLSESTLTYTSTITSIKKSTSFSFHVQASIDVELLNLRVTFNGTEIYNENLEGDLLNDTQVVSLAAYEGQSGSLVAIFTLPAQLSGVSEYYLTASADCCAIDTIGGYGLEGFDPDGKHSLITAMDNPCCIRKHSSGDLYYADSGNRIIRKIDGTTFEVTTIAGTGNSATTPTDGQPALDQNIGQVQDMAIFGDNLYFLMPNNLIVGRVDLTTGLYYNVDTSLAFIGAKLNGITVDTEGNIYYSHRRNSSNDHFIYKMTPGGTRTVFAGSIGAPGFSGDGGLATSAQLQNPFGLACDNQNNIYIADSTNARVRKVNAIHTPAQPDDGKINTIAGGGTDLTFGGLATNFDLTQDNNIRCIGVDKETQDLYIGINDIILKVNATNNLINRFSGISDAAGNNFTGDLGVPLTATYSFLGLFSAFGGIEFISSTEMYICDQDHQRIRKIYCGAGICHFSTSIEDGFFPAEGDSREIIITADCEWTLEVDQGWVTITGVISGNGDAVVSFSVAENTDEDGREANFYLRTSYGVIAAVADISQDGTGGGGF